MNPELRASLLQQFNDILDAIPEGEAVSAVEVRHINVAIRNWGLLGETEYVAKATREWHVTTIGMHTRLVGDQPQLAWKRWVGLRHDGKMELQQCSASVVSA